MVFVWLLVVVSSSEIRFKSENPAVYLQASDDHGASY